MPRHANASTARPYEGGVKAPRGGTYWHDQKLEHDYRTSNDANRMDRAMRSVLPDRPCHRCGARGFCGHDGRTAENWNA